jgi:hypothetical protein
MGISLLQKRLKHTHDRLHFQRIHVGFQFRTLHSKRLLAE